MKITTADIFGFLAKLPVVIGGVTAIISKVKSATKDDKVQAVVDAVSESVALAEFGVGQDLFNDDTIKALMAQVVSIEHDLVAAREALKAGILAKHGA